LAETSPPLRQFLRFAKRQAWLIALVPVLTVAASAFIVQREASVYRASMGIGVAESGARPPLGSPALMQTMKNILKSNVVAQGVVTQLGLPISSAALSKKIRVQYQPDSSVLNVSYDSTDKSEALSVVGQTGVEFQRVAHERLGVSDSFKRPGPLLIVASVVDPPHLEAGRVSPQPKQTLAFAAILGLALGLILAYARESLDDRIRSRDEAEKAFGAPVVGVLPRGFSHQPSTNGPPQPRQEAQQALQTLCANLEAASSGDDGSTFLVTSPRAVVTTFSASTQTSVGRPSIACWESRHEHTGFSRSSRTESLRRLRSRRSRSLARPRTARRMTPLELGLAAACCCCRRARPLPTERR